MKMTKSKKVKQEFLQQVASAGWTNPADRWGHFHVEVPVHNSEPARTRQLRLKIGTLGWRIEKKVHIPAGQWNPAENQWACMRHGYFRDGVEKAKVPTIYAGPKKA